MKKILLVAFGLLLVASAGFSQKRKNKTATPPDHPATAPTAAGAKDDTLLHRRAQVSLQDVSASGNPRVALVNGYALVLQPGQKAKLEPGDAAKMPYFLIDDQPATPADIDTLTASRVEAVSLRKRQKALKEYGEKAQHGAVIVRTKKP
jgi:hypothetical protein